MTYNRPGVGTHVINSTGGDLTHNQPIAISGFVGIAVKQKSVSWKLGLVDQNKIKAGEQFWLLYDGIVQVDNVAGFAKGDPVYITPANALTETATGNTKFGRVVEVVGDGRGVPAGKVRIDLDKKDSF
jgi:hypothetical protein